MNIETLKRFCSKDLYETRILEPYSKGEWTYANNRMILIRVPRLADVPEIDRALELNSAVFPFDEDGEWHAIPPLTSPEMVQCGECEGAGKEHALCDPCGGEGIVKCECSECGYPHTRRCSKCGGSGWHGVSDYPCPKCEGIGKVEDKHSGVVIGDAHFATRLLRLCVDNLPGVKICPKGKNQAPIMFDGGRGYVMPLQR